MIFTLRGFLGVFENPPTTARAHESVLAKEVSEVGPEVQQGESQWTNIATLVVVGTSHRVALPLLCSDTPK
jgi:hypothetical protein